MDNDTSSDKIDRILHDLKRLAEGFDKLHKDVMELLKEEENGDT